MKKRKRIALLIGTLADIVKEAAKGRPPRKNKKIKRVRSKKKK